MKHPQKTKSKIIAYILRKYTDYYKIKSYNEKLKEDIYNMVKNDDKEVGILTKMRWKFQLDIEELLLSNVEQKNDTNTFKGFFSKIE